MVSSRIGRRHFASFGTVGCHPASLSFVQHYPASFGSLRRQPASSSVIRLHSVFLVIKTSCTRGLQQRPRAFSCRLRFPRRKEKSITLRNWNPISHTSLTVFLAFPDPFSSSSNATNFVFYRSWKNRSSISTNTQFYLFSHFLTMQRMV